MEEADPRQPSTLFFDICGRMAALENKVECVLEILIHQIKNSVPASLPKSASLRPASRVPDRLSNQRPIRESWHLDWGCVPALKINENYRRCDFSNKCAHCPPGTAANWYVRWASSPQTKFMFFFMCDSCAKHFRDIGEIEGFLPILPVKC